MKQSQVSKAHRSLARNASLFGSSLILCCTLTGCLVAGYSSGGGWFIWPGSISLLLVIFLIIWLMRR